MNEPRVEPTEAANPESIQVLAGRFGSNSLATALAYGTNTGLAALVGVLLARYLGPSEYGLLVSTYAFQSFFVVLASVGIDTVVQREVARRPADSEQIIGDAVTLRMFLSLASMVAAWVVAFAIGLRGREIYLVVWVTLAFPFGCASLFLVPYGVTLRTGVPRFVLGVWSVLLSALKLGMIAAGAPLESFVALEVVSAAGGFVLSWRLGTRAGLRIRPGGTPQSWRRLLAASVPIALTLALIQVYLRVDQVMLYALRGGSETGWYGAAVRVIELANLAPIVFMASAFPLLARLGAESPSGLERATRLSLRALAWLAWPFAIWVAWEAPRLVHLFFGPGWEGSVPVLRALAWSVPTTFLNSVLFNRLFATREQRSATVLALVAALSNVLLNLLLIPTLGGTGAALASVVSYGTVTLVALGPTPSRPTAVWGLRAQARPALLAFGAGLILHLLRLPLVPGALLFAVGYAAALRLSGEFGPEEARLVGRMLGGRRPT